MRLLLVEDDALLGDGLRAGLALDGYGVDWVRDGEAARLALLAEDYDACVLDLGLPRRDGLSVLRELRGRNRRTPVLILTARDSSADKVAGLDAGADDYLLKPFDLAELQARLRALLRRAAGEAAPLLRHADLTLDPAARRVTQAGRSVALSAREYALLHDLISHKGHIRSRQELETGLYAWGEEVESNTVEVYIHHLRKKLGADLIRTVRGLGYVLGGNALTAGRPPASLRTRLLLMLLAATGLVWLAAAWWSYGDARHEAEELLDAQLAQSARLLLAQTRHELVDEGETHLAAYEALDEREMHPYEQKLLFRVRDAAGRTLLASANPPPAVSRQASGYADVRIGGAGWRVLATGDAALRVEVAQSLAIRDELARQVAMRLALPVILALPLLAGLIYLVVGRALRPLDDLAGKVAARTAANLAPLQAGGLPREVRPLALALNRLLDRLNLALDSERRFTADAAHELRTPLAAIQVQAQVALASADGDGRRHALEQVLAGTRRATRLLEQLLRLARLDPLTGLSDARRIDLAALAAQVADDLPPLAGAGRLRIESGASVTVAGDADLLGVALRNLVDNALRHTPPDGEVAIGMESRDGATRLWVADTGPGVAEDELPRLTERFYRGRDIIAEGSGLGLAIVQRIAELHGARLVLENRPQGGLRAALVWETGRSG